MTGTTTRTTAGTAASLGPVPVLPDYVDEQLVDRLGIEITTCAPELVVGTMPVAGNRQPVGIMHGGANAAFAETLGSLAAWVHAGTDRIIVGLELSCTHHRVVRQGTVTGVCRPLHVGEVRPPTRSSSATSGGGGPAPPGSPVRYRRPGVARPVHSFVVCPMEDYWDDGCRSGRRRRPVPLPRSGGCRRTARSRDQAR
ncbi:hotdog fold thioesterase [Streptomyces sp. NBC_01537]|uniref:hotdog fold thioesterase n=1 Tax=Streptomyces sp. NBC_01537 TaxID=2903896 RepID=UPI00386B9B46